MKLLKRLLAFIVVLLMIIAVVLWFLPAPLIKWAVEHFGSEAVGAKVEVSAVEFDWYPTRISILDLAVTNPKKVMSNALKIGEISAQLDLLTLIDGRVYLDLVAVQDIAVDTPRSSSGALPGYQVVPSTANSDFQFPDLGFPDPEQLIAKEKALYQSKITAFKVELDAREQRWKKITEDLPDDARLQVLKAEWETVKKGNVIEKLTKAKQFEKTVKKDIDKLKDTQRQLKSEYALLKQDYERLTHLADGSASDIIKNLGLSDSSLAQLGTALLDDTVQAWLNEAYNYYSMVSADSGVSDDSEESEASLNKTEPSFLLKLMTLSGQFTLQEKVGRLTGNIANISDAPGLHKEPITFAMLAEGETLGALNLNSVIDHRIVNASRDSVMFSLKNSPLSHFEISQQPSFGMVLNDAKMNIQIDAAVLNQETLALKLDAAFSHLDFGLSGTSLKSSWGASLADSITSMKQLTLSATANGPVYDPEIALSTNLNQVMKQALSSVVKTKSKELENRLKVRLQETLDEELRSVSEKLDGLSNLPTVSDKRKDEFEALLKLK